MVVYTLSPLQPACELDPRRSNVDKTRGTLSTCCFTFLLLLILIARNPVSSFIPQYNPNPGTPNMCVAHRLCSLLQKCGGREPPNHPLRG